MLHLWLSVVRRLSALRAPLSTTQFVHNTILSTAVAFSASADSAVCSSLQHQYEAWQTEVDRILILINCPFKFVMLTCKPSLRFVECSTCLALQGREVKPSNLEPCSGSYLTDGACWLSHMAGYVQKQNMLLQAGAD